jgi:hypothetical protein
VTNLVDKRRTRRACFSLSFLLITPKEMLRACVGCWLSQLKNYHLSQISSFSRFIAFASECMLGIKFLTFVSRILAIYRNGRLAKNTVKFSPFKKIHAVLQLEESHRAQQARSVNSSKAQKRCARMASHFFVCAALN